MKLKKIIVSFLFCAFASHSYAQLNMGMMDSWVDADLYTRMNVAGKQIDLNTVKGTPLLYEDFLPGEVKQVKEDKSLTANIRYNVYKDVFEIKTDDNKNEIGTLDKNNLLSFELRGEEFKYFSGPRILFEYGNSVNGYLVVVDENEINNKEITLLKRYHKKFEPEQKPTSSYGSGSPANFKSGVAYYAKVDDDYFKITPHKRKAYKDFPEAYQDKVKKFMKKNKIKFKGSEAEQETELKQLMNFLILSQ